MANVPAPLKAAQAAVDAAKEKLANAESNLQDIRSKTTIAAVDKARTALIAAQDNLLKVTQEQQTESGARQRTATPAETLEQLRESGAFQQPTNATLAEVAKTLEQLRESGAFQQDITSREAAISKSRTFLDTLNKILSPGATGATGGTGSTGGAEDDAAVKAAAAKAAADKAAADKAAADKAAADKAAADKAAKDAADKTAQDAADKAAADAAAKAEAARLAELEKSKPGPAWILNPDKTAWIKPPMPPDGSFVWNDIRGWVPRTSDKPAQPGKAWVWDNATQKWIQPDKPTDGEYTWNDDTGWVKQPSGPDTDTGPGKGTGAGTGAAAEDPAITALKKQLADALSKLQAGTVGTTAQYADLATKVQSLASAQQAQVQAQQQNAIAFLTSTFSDLGLTGDIAASVTRLVQQGYSADTIQLIAQDPNSSDPLAVAFRTRFPANAARLKAGLPVLTPGEYLATERAYNQVMQAYGLPAGFSKNQEIFTRLLSSDVSPTELNTRISTARQVVENTDPFVVQQLQTYYGLSQGDMIAHVLDPAFATPLIQKQVAAAQIGGAATAQGYGLSQVAAESLYGQGVTQAQAQVGFRNIAQEITPAQKLAATWGGSAALQGQNLVASTFGTAGAAYAEQQLQALVRKETSAFQGSSGIAKGSLGTAAAEAAGGIS